MIEQITRIGRFGNLFRNRGLTESIPRIGEHSNSAKFDLAGAQRIVERNKDVVSNLKPKGYFPLSTENEIAACVRKIGERISVVTSKGPSEVAIRNVVQTFINDAVKAGCVPTYKSCHSPGYISPAEFMKHPHIMIPPYLMQHPQFMIPPYISPYIKFTPVPVKSNRVYWDIPRISSGTIYTISDYFLGKRNHQVKEALFSITSISIDLDGHGSPTKVPIKFFGQGTSEDFEEAVKAYNRQR